MHNRNFFFLFTGILSITAIVFLAYQERGKLSTTEESFLARVWDSVSSTEEPSVNSTPDDNATSELPQEFIHEDDRYQNTAYGFSFTLPAEYTTQSNPVWDDSHIYTFDGGGEKSFQIFVTPHDEPIINPERIKLDVPDIVMNNIRTATLDSVEALVFESHDSSVGDTYEVWFVRNDHLYQMTTYREHQNELNEILSTWKFE